MTYRKEKDSLGERDIPLNALWGIQTLRAKENFPVSGIMAPAIFVESYVLIKKACLMANQDLGVLPIDKAQVIKTAADEILGGLHRDQFVIDIYQAGAGTSFNMNVNEVLANRALEILGHPKGEYSLLSPNDHVNRSQSTNDTFPTASHVSILLRWKKLKQAVEVLIEAYERKADEFENVVKSARTHLQDAVPITLGQEFEAYAEALKASLRQIEVSARELRAVALGATAAGTGLNAPVGFKNRAVEYLGELAGLQLTSAKNPFFALQSHFYLLTFSSSLRSLAVELIRLANDLRLLASGPLTGFNEIVLPAVQPGSSIMPGKVNPSMAECLNQIAFDVIGADGTVVLAAQAGQLDLNVMTPVSTFKILHCMEILENFLPVFAERCIRGIIVNRDRCEFYFGQSPSLATALTAKMGYLKAAEIYKDAVTMKKTVLDIVKERSLLSEEEIKNIFDPKFLTGRIEEQ